MKLDLEKLKKEAIKAIKEAEDAEVLESLRIKYLGRAGGAVNKFIGQLPNLSLADRRKFGPAVNALKRDLESALENKLTAFKAQSLKLKAGIDITMPGKKVSLGHLHPLTLVEKEIREIFKAMNFSVVEGPEVESEYYNFDALNIPKDHPAREMWDTFWLQNGQLQSAKCKVQSVNDSRFAIRDRLLLRTHTSPVQIRYMETHQPPFQIIVPGRVFRYEATDASHEINFHQVEGLMVGKDINLANFKFVIEEFFKRLFKKNVAVRLRPSYFPFVEPGLEVDVQCVKCSMRMPEQSSMRKAHANEFCNVCKGTRWLEVMGAGMVHPRVFEAAGYNPRDLQGFAFGLGLERIAMIKYNIPDIRLFYSGDLRFIKQF